jgi:MFS family permease
MESAFHSGVNWRALFARPGFPFLFSAMFVSLFGTGMNYAGVTWYILERTNSTVSVSLMIILVTLPGLIVPAFGGVLIDRVDRRYLGIVLDLTRGLLVLATAGLLFWGVGRLWHIYAMITLLGVGAAIYWSTMNALLQEVVLDHDSTAVNTGQLAGANAAILIAVQGGMMSAGALVGFLYEHTGIAGILAIDGATYFASALCLLFLREGYFVPHRHEPPPTIEAPPGPRERDSEPPVLPAIVEPGLVAAFAADLREGLAYLRQQPRVLALGLTFACMMAGVISANVLVVVLARDVLHSGARGYGFMEAGWAIGAILGGLLTAELARRFAPMGVLLVALVTLSVGHALFPYVGLLLAAVAMNAVFGACRALAGVLAQTSIMSTVPRRLMGRTQSAFGVISTLLQVAMSFSLGWLAQHVSLPVAFAVLGLMYAGAAAAALRARSLQG